MGENKSEYEFNPKTVHGDIREEAEKVIDINKELRNVFARQRITNLQSLKRAERLAQNLTDEKVLNVRVGDTMPVEELLAVQAYSSKRFKEVHKNPNSSQTERQLVNLMFIKSEALKSETGRALQGISVIEKLSLEEKRGIIEELPDEWKKEGQKLLKEVENKEPDAFDKIKYWLYNAMLSNPITHARNMVGNISHLTYESVLNGVMNPVLTVKGLSKGFTNIIPRIKEIMKGSEETNKWFEGRRYEPKNKIVRNTMPLKWLEIEDVVFKELSKGMEREFQVRGLSKQFKDKPETVRQLMQDVLEGRELETEEKTAKYLQALEDIDKYGKYVTFQSELGSTGKAFTNLINKSKAGFLVVPFIRTPINIMKVGLQPLKVLKFVSPEFRAKFKELSKSEQTHIYRRIAAGSLLYSVIAGLALNGQIEITGSGPDDRTKRDLLERQGWKPNSIKVGSKYVSYQNLNPVNILFAMIGNYSDNMKYNTKPKDDELSAIQKISKTLAGFAETFTDQSFLQGINNLFKWKNKKDPYYLEQFLQMPVPGVLAVGKSIDIIKGEELPSYEAKGFMEKLKNKIGYTEGLKERLDIFGDTKIRTYESLPIPYSEKEDKLAKLILDNDISIGYPSKSVTKPDGTKITEDEYYTYLQETGQEIKRVLTENYDEISKLTPDEMEKFIDDTTKDIRKEARERLFGKKTRESISYQTMDALSKMNETKPSGIRRPKTRRPYEKKY